MVAIMMKHVTKTYGHDLSKVQALQDIDFQADFGQLIGVVGPSGSGKSTFLEIVGGLLTPTSGTIKIDNQSYQDLSASQRENLRLNKIGFVLQAYNLVPYLTISEQFELVKHVKKTANMTANEFQQVIQRLQIDPLLDKYPETLSGGQQQRAAIARALFANPQIILADEPTAALDTKRAFEVMEIFRDLAHSTKKTIIVVTHDTRLEKYVDQLYNINDGKMEFVQ
ncbi:ABC transporter ATP-binding protein [Bombilactobacillus bombi]|uniref:ABC transporter ATP-binding protein n=1 Tax=Bombilactobacillus bombi TaxID=1303590 RepID=UPI0015E61881|nr:ABC transporter ATP-binding protein [Bombilactobacillus bombi]MBA1434382.1 ABC transporter ATP-binding protein [Bombilactobacillus bombi]